MNVIETRGLTKRYRRKLAVDNLGMTVAAGDIYGFVGKNGSGKSTTMKMICGLARPTAGEVVLFGDPENGAATPQGFSCIGALIESPGVLASLTARDNLVAKALALGMTHAGQVADDLLGLVGLDPRDHRRVKAYSLGMKQRLGLVLALVGSPDLLLLDEPFNGLDPEATRAMRLALVRLNHEHGVTIMISSHVLDQLDRVATRFGVISDGPSHGRVHRRGAPRALRQLRAPAPGAAGARAGAPRAGAPAGDLPRGAGRRARGHGAALEEVSAACFTAGVEVRELVQQERDIEEYFVELMGGADGEKDGEAR